MYENRVVLGTLSVGSTDHNACVQISLVQSLRAPAPASIQINSISNTVVYSVLSFKKRSIFYSLLVQ